MANQIFDLDHFLPYLLNQAAEITSQSFQSAYKEEYGMTRSQWRVMANLGKHGTLTAADICRRTFIEKTKVSRAVQALEESGMLKRLASKDDRRFEQLSLTPKGKSIFKIIGQRAKDFDKKLQQHLGHDQAQALELLLRKLVVQ